MSGIILPGHGSGGKLMNDLVENVIKKILGPDSVQLDDSAVLSIGNENIVFTTDTFVISPVFFPGGDIGKLAVNGTVNDLAVMGAKPMFLSCGIILEEGFHIDSLVTILHSMKEAADIAGVKIVTGDTKVVQKGNADQVFINTTGIGTLTSSVQRKPIETGDKILINGYIGDHGIAVMAERNKLTFSEGLVSDCASLYTLISAVSEEHHDSIKFMRDPTRGGIASVLNELVRNKKTGAKLIESKLPVRDEVMGVCELLGIDPLYTANEGKVILIVKQEKAQVIIDTMKSVDIGKEACIIGEITDKFPGKVYLETFIGGNRILPLLVDEQLPRIC